MERNFRCRQGEIDIIAKEEETLLFVEVKYRSDTAYGYPSEAVTWKKQNKILYTANYYKYRYHIREDVPCRFDVIEVLGNRIRWMKNAF